MFTVIFDSSSHIPMYRQLYEYIKNGITFGEFKGDEKLPSKRALASHLRISIVTVETAYEMLASEGYIYSLPKKGFYVEKGLESAVPQQLPLSDKCKVVSKKSDRRWIYDLSTSGVDTDCFPFSAWAKLMRSVLADENEKLLKNVDSRGSYELRLAISHHLYSFRGISASPENIIIGAGTEYLTSLIMLLLGTDKCYAVENPGYGRTYRLFKKSAGKAAAIPQDSSGISIEKLRSSGADIVHTTPSHHFPTGSIMPVARRMELLGWTREKAGRYIIEDEYDSEFRFTGGPVPALFSLDKYGRVIYINTFTKTLAPSMRISYMVLPDSLMEKFRTELDFCSNTVPLFEQLTLARFISEGFFERHINRIKKIYRNRRDLFIGLLKQNLPPNSFEIRGENSGLHFLMKINGNVSEQQLAAAAAEKGIKIHVLSEYYQQPCKIPKGVWLVIGYTQLSSDDITNAAKLLADAWKQFL